MGIGGTQTAQPPTATITFAKSVNLNEGPTIRQDVIAAKKLGANMVTIWPARRIQNDEFVFFFHPELSSLIRSAHNNGLQVELRSSYQATEETKNYEKFKANALQHVAEFAQFAEKNNVYRLVPFGELDNQLLNHCNKITELAQELLTEMRKYYSGKIGVGVVAPWRDCGFSFKGYDYVTVSAYPHNDVATSINWARNVADRSGIKILHVGETGVLNPDDRSEQQNFQTKVMSKKEEARFYDDFFEQFSGNVNGISVFYNSGMNFMSIYGDPAEEVVKDWYGKLEK